MELPPDACPFCHGDVPGGALKCRHCGEWLSPHCPRCGKALPAGAPACPACVPGTGPRPRALVLLVKALALFHAGHVFAGIAAFLSCAFTPEPETARLAVHALSATLSALVGWLYWVAARSLNVLILGLLTALYFLATLSGLLDLSSPTRLFLFLLLQLGPFLATAAALYQALVWGRAQSEAPGPEPDPETDGLAECLLRPRFGIPPREVIPTLLAWSITLLGVGGLLTAAPQARRWELFLAFGLMAPLAHLLIHRLQLLGAGSPSLAQGLRTRPAVHGLLFALALGAVTVMPTEAPAPRPFPIPEPPAGSLPESRPIQDPWAREAAPPLPLPGVLTPDRPTLPVPLGGRWFLLPCGAGPAAVPLEATAAGLAPLQAPPLAPLPEGARLSASRNGTAWVESPQGLFRVDLASGVPTLKRIADALPGSASLDLGDGTLARLSATNLERLDDLTGARHWLKPLPAPRAETACVALPGGRILRLGGRQPDGSVSAATDHVFTGDFFTVAGPLLPSPRTLASACALDGGQVALVGGLDPAGRPVRSVCVFHAKNAFFLTLGTLGVDRTRPQLQVLPAGWLLVTGGEVPGTGTCLERIHLTRGQVQSCRLPRPGAGPLAALPLADGSLLVFHCGPGQPVYHLPAGL